MDEQEEKRKFAEALLSCGKNPLEAGQLVHPHNFNRAAQIASLWHNDPVVKKLIREIEKESIEETGQSEIEIYVESRLKEIIESNKVYPEDKIKALDKLMSLHSLHKKPDNALNVSVVVPKVIEVTNYGTDEEWEAAAVQQQRELKNVSRTRH